MDDALTRTRTPASPAKHQEGLTAQQGAGESFLLTLLTNRAERKDTRVFAHAASETQTAITDAYTSRPASRAANSALEPGFLEVFPRVTSRPPRLLQELESVLVDRQRAADKAAFASAVPGAQLPKERDQQLSANLSLDVHRQVFAAFIAGFAAYAPLLEQIQVEFESALSEGLRCAHENVGLRLRMAAEDARREVAAQDVRAKILAEESAFRQAAAIKLQETKERTSRLLRRAAAAERDLAQARAEQARLQALVASLRASSDALAGVSQGEAAWQGQPTSATVRVLQVGPLSNQEEALVESEYVSIRDLKQARGALGRAANTADAHAA